MSFNKSMEPSPPEHSMYQLKAPNTPIILSIAGWSGSGKTWVIEKLIPILHQHKLKAAFLKHDGHQLIIDNPKKDTGRFFSANASFVMAHDANSGFVHFHKPDLFLFHQWLQSVSCEVDCIIVEGHKDSPWPKIWLEHPTNNETSSSNQIIKTVPWSEERVSIIADIVLNFVAEKWKSRNAYAGILIGGKSKRMGQPKHLLQWNNASVLDHLVNQCAKADLPVVLLGNQYQLDQNMTYLPDIPECKGPLAGMIAAMRWNPSVSWLFLSCDMPLFSVEAIRWLLKQRSPGRWAIAPYEPNQDHSFGAIYEPQYKPIFESGVMSGILSVRSMLEHSKVAHVPIPKNILSCWRNCNTPEEWNEVQRIPSR